MKNGYIKVGKIVNTFGIKGEVKIYLHTDFPDERFQKDNEFYVGDELNPTQFKLKVERSKPYKNVYLVKFKDFDSINQVEKYRNLYLWITKEQQHDLDEGEYYYHEIMGCKVVTTDGESLGEISDILNTGANDVWVIKPNTGKKDILIPYIEEIVKDIDIEGKTITIQMMEGLLP